jgi:hypothetical protein
MKKYMKFKRINGLSKLNENRILNNIIEMNIFNWNQLIQISIYHKVKNDEIITLSLGNLKLQIQIIS